MAVVKSTNPPLLPFQAFPRGCRKNGLGKQINQLVKKGDKMEAEPFALAQELAPQVRVNAVAPGVIVWPEQGDWDNEERRRQIVEHTLLKREGEPDDIAKTVQFLLSQAPYITGQVIAVDVEDTGEGIDEKVLLNIFAPFFTTKPKGTGLGLALCHRIVEEHEGDIEVKSEKGKGTVFSVYLPV